MEILKSFFSRKKIGFFIGAFCALWSLICSIVYIIGFSSTGELGEYTSYGVFVFTFLAFIAFVGLSTFKQTSGLAAPLMGIFVFVAFILFVIDGYMYFPEVFYGGFTVLGLFGMNFAFLFCLLSMILIVIISSVCIYLKQEKEQTTSEVKV